MSITEDQPRPVYTPPTLNEMVAKKTAVHLGQGKSIGVAGLNAYREFSEEAYKLLTELLNTNAKSSVIEFLDRRRPKS
jgi:hypothetical protein